jgi:hypothetical protein
MFTCVAPIGQHGPEFGLLANADTSIVAHLDWPASFDVSTAWVQPSGLDVELEVTGQRTTLTFPASPAGTVHVVRLFDTEAPAYGDEAGHRLAEITFRTVAASGETSPMHSPPPVVTATVGALS